MNSKNISGIILFILVFTGMSLFYDYPHTLLKPPQSIHNWRQFDGASLALNYYQEGMHFFKPQTHMLYSDGHKTGYTTPSEIPILYYFVAILYKIFGYHLFIFRAVNLLIFFIGLFYLFRLAMAVLNDLLFAITVTALIFSSPLLIYYGNNFMPNTVALSFSFIGWYYFYRYYINKKTRTFLLSMFFFGIAGSMKITELTAPILISGLLLSERFGLIQLDLKSRKNFGIKMASIGVIFLIVAGWVIYAKYYNNLHDSLQFSTYIFPIWGISKEAIHYSLYKMNHMWFKDYFYPATFWFMSVCIILTVILHKRANKILLISSQVYVLALIAFSLLWFEALGDHDYFFIGFYVLPALLFINFFHIIKSFGYNKTIDLIIRSIFVIIVIMNIYYGKGRHERRYSESWINDYRQMEDLYIIKPWLEDAEISLNDSTIFYPSRYVRPLYLMNVKGWVIFNHDEISPEIEKRDSMLMHTFVRNGAKYFMTNDIKSAIAYKPLLPYMKDLYGKYNSIFIFRIPPVHNNFNTSDSLLFNY